ncbi:MAG TPA: hypothetical protein VMT96_00180 [Candidatus Bathyarchaeia archaeon]|nr:hypothetical protein [Candidatus Bathyarchaeia archaeon]
MKWLYRYISLNRQQATTTELKQLGRLIDQMQTTDLDNSLIELKGFITKIKGISTGSSRDEVQQLLQDGRALLNTNPDAP